MDSQEQDSSVKSWVVGLDVMDGLSQQASGEVHEGHALHVAAIFQPGCVLQRDQELPVWGRGMAGDRVSCELAGHRVSGVCDGRGRFLLRLPGCAARLEPQTLRVENESTHESQVISPVYIGEVFLVSGQSNMAFAMQGEAHFPELAAAGELQQDRIHVFKVPVRALKNPPEDFPPTVVWEQSTAQTTPKVSAIGFLAARQLARTFPHIHVGVIDTACGGTGIEAWTSREGLAANPFWGPRLAIYHSPEHQDKDGMEALRDMFPDLPAYDETKENYHTPECRDEDWETMTVPDSWTMTGRNYAGIFWFRRDFELKTIPPDGVTLSLGAVDKGDETYVNGTLVGKMGDGLQMETTFTKRVYQVPPQALRIGRNVIAVRILSAVSIVADGGLIGPAEDMFVAVEKQRLPLTGTWRFKEMANLGTKAADSFSFCGEGSGHSMHILFDNMLAPIIPYAIRAAAWYQGECNAVCQAGEYYECLKSWAQDWTRRWAQKDLKLIVIQLPGYMRQDLYQPYSQWARIRDAQQRFCMETNMPLVVATDTGEVDNIHPVDKAAVAKRTAEILIACIQGKRIPQSPVAVRARRMTPDTIRVDFECYGSTLKPETGDTRFILVRPDATWTAVAPAQVGDTFIELKGDASQVRKVVYNWSNFPLGRLYNDQGLPVAPFDCELSD